MVTQAIETAELPVRLNRVLRALGVAVSVWYGKAVLEPKKPGRKPQAVPEALAAQIQALAERYPWWGYKRIAVVARRAGVVVSNQVVYRVFKAAGLLQKKRVREASLYQAARLLSCCRRRPTSCGRPM